MSFPAYPAYKDSGVEWLGAVPEHWSVLPVKWVGWLKGGAGFPHDKQGVDSHELDFHKVNALASADSDGVLRSSENTITRETAKQLGAHVFPKETIVFAKVGAALLLGRLRTISAEACLDNNMMGLIVFRGKVSNQFALYSMGTVRFDLIANPGAVPSLNEGQIGNYRLAIPGLPEQTQIARFLDHETACIDALIEEQQRLIELLKEKRQAVISHAVTKGLDPTVPMKDSGVEWLGEVPAHWRSLKVKRLFTQSKRQGYTDMEVLSVYRDYGVVKKSSRDDNNNKTPDDLSLYQLVMAGDLVVNKMKAWQGSLGVSEYQGITSPDYVVYSPSHGEAPKFLHYLLRASHMPKVYLSISNGIRPSQWRIEPEKFEHVEVFLPEKAEQLEIVIYLENQLTRINELMLCCEQASNFFSERRSALISAAVTGKIDVRGWQPPASAPTPELVEEAV